jgi:hypothetical protein
MLPPEMAGVLHLVLLSRNRESQHICRWTFSPPTVTHNARWRFASEITLGTDEVIHLNDWSGVDVSQQLPQLRELLVVVSVSLFLLRHLLNLHFLMFCVDVPDKCDQQNEKYHPSGN